jgi:hypothetical protein
VDRKRDAKHAHGKRKGNLGDKLHGTDLVLKATRPPKYGEDALRAIA